MGRLLFAVFMIVPLIEIAFFIIIGNAIGLWPTLLGVVVMAIAGALILRYQGLAVVNEIRTSMGQRQLPARALADAMMIGAAGLLLISPGYFTDILGLLLLVPPVRSAIYAFLKSRVQVVATTAGGPGAGFGRENGPRVIDLDDGDWRQR